jgi:DNA-damage-inducible protein J
MTQSAILRVRLDAETKAKGDAALETVGLSDADAVRLLYRRILTDQAFAFELKVPNAVSREAITEADAILTERRARNSDALID